MLTETELTVTGRRVRVGEGAFHLPVERRSGDAVRPWLPPRAFLAGLVIVDALAGAGAAALAGIVTGTVSLPVAVLAAAPLWPALLVAVGAYDQPPRGDGARQARRVLDAGLWALVALVAGSLALGPHTAGPAVAVFAAMATLAGIAIHGTAGSDAVTRLRGASSVRRAVVAGARSEVREVLEHLGRNPRSGIRVIGVCTAGWEGLSAFPGDVPLLGGVLESVDAARRAGADTVLLAGAGALRAGDMRRLCLAVEGTGIDLVVAPPICEVAGPRVTLRRLGDLPVLHVREPELTGPARVAKAVLDRAGAALLLTVLSPVLLGIAGAIRVTSRGPILFRQTRVGRHGRAFVLLKFRTMYDGAEDHRHAVAHLNELDGVLFKIRRDPRVTVVGRVLRRLSLDELPQLWNVLTGSMSLVGPRPQLPAEVANCDSDVRRRLLVKPGITGLWQVSGRSDLSWEETVRLDLHYVENWSVALDVQLMLRTLAAVAGGRGAY